MMHRTKGESHRINNQFILNALKCVNNLAVFLLLGYFAAYTCISSSSVIK